MEAELGGDAVEEGRSVGGGQVAEGLLHGGEVAENCRRLLAMSTRRAVSQYKYEPGEVRGFACSNSDLRFGREGELLCAEQRHWNLLLRRPTTPCTACQNGS